MPSFSKTYTGLTPNAKVVFHWRKSSDTAGVNLQYSNGTTSSSGSYTASFTYDYNIEYTYSLYYGQYGSATTLIDRDTVYVGQITDGGGSGVPGGGSSGTTAPEVPKDPPSQPKAIYIGVSSKARKVNKLYVGVSNIARQIKKAYIGVGGIARPVYSYEDISYYGLLATPLINKRGGLAGASNNSYAIFAGGVDYYNYYNTCDVYSSTLTRSTNSLIDSMQFMGSTTFNNHAVFAGGHASYGDQAIGYGFNTSLTKQTFGMNARSRLGAASTGSYLILAGGESSGYMSNTYVECFGTSWIKHIGSFSIQEGKKFPDGTNVGEYAIFGGGLNSSGTGTKTVDAFNNSLTYYKCTDLSYVRAYPAVFNIGYYAIVSGGGYSSIEVYNNSLTKLSTITLPEALANPKACSFGNIAVFGGGISGDGNYPSSSYVIDNTLTCQPISGFTTPRSFFASAAIGDYALFGGGYNQYTGSSTEFYNSVECYLRTK